LKQKIAIIFLLISAVTITYQQCSLGGEAGGIANLPSGSGGGGGGGGGGTLSVTSDESAKSLPGNATSFVVNGSCTIGTYTNYSFDVTYQANGAANQSFRSYPGSCLGGRFSLNIANSDLQIVAGTPGTLRIKIAATGSNGIIESNEASIAISWQSLRVLASCTVETSGQPPNSWGVAGATNSITGSCTPPAGTISIKLGYALDDGGTIAVNGVNVINVPNDCTIKSGSDISVTMTAGVANSVTLTAVNCGLAGVGGRATFDFWGY